MNVNTNYIKTTTRLNPTCLPIIAPGPYSNYNNVRIVMTDKVFGEVIGEAIDEAMDNASGNAT